VVVDLVAAAAAVTLVGAASTAVVGSILADKSQVELAPGEVASASVERASDVVFRTLKAQDPGFLRLGIRRTRSPSSMVLANKRRGLQSQGSRISALEAFATTSYRVMMRTGMVTGTGGMLTLIMVASLCLSTAFGVD
jgi:hypothetical protein